MLVTPMPCKESGPTHAMHPSDASLIFAAARSRDTDAIGEFTRRYAALLYSVGLRVSNNDDDARRLAGELALDVAADPDCVRGEPVVWLHQEATRRIALSHSTNGHKPGRDLVEEPHWDELRHAIDTALLRLRSRHRHIIIQHYFQRHSQDELTQILQVTQPVVALRLRKALEALRSKLVEAGVGCSLAHLMMLLARHGASEAPQQMVDQLAHDAADRLASAKPPRRTGWLGLIAVWAVIAGLIVAVAVSYSTLRNPAEANPPPNATP